MSNRMSSSEAVPDQRGTASAWWLPAGTFLAGCALGAAVIGVGNVGGDDEPIGSVAAPTADAEAGDDGVGAAGDEGTGGGAGDAGTGESTVYVRVPESCAQTAEDVTALLEQVDDVVAAVAGLDPERLRQAVDDVQQVRDDVQDVAEQCQEAAAQSQVDVGDSEDDAGTEGVEDGDVEDEGVVDDAEPTTPAA